MAPRAQLMTASTRPKRSTHQNPRTENPGTTAAGAARLARFDRVQTLSEKEGGFENDYHFLIDFRSPLI
jgi:hypothetical protein